MSDSDSLDVNSEQLGLESFVYGDAEVQDDEGERNTMHKRMSMAEHLAAARSDMRTSMPGDVPLSKFVREVQRREAAEVELCAQRQVIARDDRSRSMSEALRL